MGGSSKLGCRLNLALQPGNSAANLMLFSTVVLVYGQRRYSDSSRIIRGRRARFTVAPRQAAQKTQLIVKSAATEAHVQMILEAFLFDRRQRRILLAALGNLSMQRSNTSRNCFCSSALSGFAHSPSRGFQCPVSSYMRSIHTGSAESSSSGATAKCARSLMMRR